MTNAIEAVVEILTWVTLGAGIVSAGLALVAYLVDGTWVPVRGFVEHEDDGIVVRWFDEDNAVNQASLTAEEWRHLGGGGTVEIFARRGYRSRMRAHPRSGAVRALALLAAILLGVGVVCLVLSLVLLFVAG